MSARARLKVTILTVLMFLVALVILAAIGCPRSPPVEPRTALVEAAETGSDQFGFFVVGDSRERPEVMQGIVRAMVEMDPDAVACFNTGDITSDGTAEEWAEHLRALAAGAPDPSVPAGPSGLARQSRLRSDVAEFGPWIRYIGILGNHDDNHHEWLEVWNTALPGQRALGVNSDDGVYFALSYGNALFVVLDSVNPSAAQTAWLERVLTSVEARRASWIFTFFHHPVYPCNPKEPFEEGLEWVELMERHGVDIAFVAHSHTYERTCPMRGGRCAEGGVIYLNSSAAGAPVRPLFERRTETVRYDGRVDEFDCEEILEHGRGRWDHFCHVEVDRCRLRLACYDSGWAEDRGPAEDQLLVDRCE